MSTDNVYNGVEREAYHLVNFYELYVDGVTLYYTDAETDTVFNTNTYTALPIKSDTISQSSSLEIPSLKITLSNITRKFTQLAAQYDGLVGYTVSIKTTTSDLISSGDYVETTWIIDQIQMNVAEAELSLVSVLSPSDLKIPRRIMSRYHCGWKYKDPNTCQYAGTIVACTKTFYACQDHGNVEKFGGFPDLPVSHQSKGI